MKLIGVGDNVVDYYKDQGKIYPGGNALNVAVFYNRLSNHQSSYMGIVGNDESAEHVVNTLQQEKMDISRVRRAVGENGMAIVTLDEQGDRVFVGSNKGGVQSRLKLMLNELDLTYIRQHDLLHTSVFSHLESDLPLLHKIIDISFDFSTRYDEEYLQQVCPYISYAFFSGSSLPEEECMNLIKRVHLLGTSVVCVTRGEEGALLSVENQLFKQPIIPTNVVDTLGAGDSFIAGFLSSYLPEKNIAKALHNGSLVASQTCQNYGAFGYGKEYHTDCAIVLK
ncbi:fructoselysine 6-kinase [Priestia megaterium]|uniref:fructoselysine 6-kinase n=1 Tax=Priestia megaterium TaxID=1404 RepID=UPI0030C8E323